MERCWPWSRLPCCRKPSKVPAARNAAGNAGEFPVKMVVNGDFMVLNGDFVVFNGYWMVFHGDFGGNYWTDTLMSNGWKRFKMDHSDSGLDNVILCTYTCIPKHTDMYIRFIYKCVHIYVYIYIYMHTHIFVYLEVCSKDGGISKGIQNHKSQYVPSLNLSDHLGWFGVAIFQEASICIMYT